MRGTRRAFVATRISLPSPGPRPRSTPILTVPNPSQSFEKHLASLGLGGVGTVFRNLSVPQLYEHALRKNEAALGIDGQLLVETGKHTGRSPKDKFLVREPGSETHIDWGNNAPIEPAKFDALLARVADYLDGKDVYSLDCHVGADPRYRMPVRIITQYAWHSLFARDLFIDDADDVAESFSPEFTVIDAALFEADPERDGVRSSTFVLVNFARKIILIGGTRYAGEIKKSVFSVMNYLMPLRNVLSMHCSANVGQRDDVAIFFGLSGTGKTTLSSDPHRPLIGDDEHGWSADGVFNFEGGCYAKMIKLRADAEPEIWAASHRYGAVLENVVYDAQTRELDVDSTALTENTRSAYPVDFLPNFVKSGMANSHPKTIIMLTADAFGVLPPIAKLTPAQAMYHFLSGYTAKVAGTERGVTEPTATFSTCFGAPFMVHHPTVYAKLLGERIDLHGSTCWLVNTGWTGGGYGVGSRMKIAYTRAMVNAAIDGKLNDVSYHTEPFFGLALPDAVPGVPTEVLNPRNAWADTADYDRQALKLATLFEENFQRFAAHASPDILAVAIHG